MKRVTPCLVVLVVLVMASCAPAGTPQNTYAAQMQPAIASLTKFQDDFTSLETLLTEQLDPSTGVTRLQLIDLYNISMEYKITRDEYSKLGLMPLDALVAPAVKVSKDGKSILETLSAVTPTEDLKADHQVVLDCVQSRIAFAEELSSSIKELSAIDMSKAGDLVACDQLDASVGKLTAFVDENK
ncbi:MAG TPA: hypothetical protein VK909_17810 [Anaerolineales bacterium]|nr:hypothetical protein [Anaerolineales bacterium]